MTAEETQKTPIMLACKRRELGDSITAKQTRSTLTFLMTGNKLIRKSSFPFNFSHNKRPSPPFKPSSRHTDTPAPAPRPGTPAAGAAEEDIGDPRSHRQPE